MSNNKILIADDDAHIAELIKLYFEKDGFTTVTANNGRTAVELFKSEAPSIVILDVMMPEMDGWQVCREIRRVSNIPIIMLTAKGSIDDKVCGLSSGADDYITKPFELREVTARVRTILRRYRKTKSEGSEKIEAGEIVICEQERTVYRNGEMIELTPKEFDLLIWLVKNPKRVFTRTHLLDEIWGYDFAGGTRTVDIHIQRLRKKVDLGDSIVTVFGVGYKYVPKE